MLGKRRRSRRTHRVGHGSGPTRPLFRPVIRYILTVEQYWTDSIASAGLLPINPAITGRPAGAAFQRMYNTDYTGTLAGNLAGSLPIPHWMMGCRVATGGFGVHPYSELLAALLDDAAIATSETFTPQYGVSSGLLTIMSQYAFTRGVGCVWSWHDDTPASVDSITQQTTMASYGVAQPLEKRRANVFGFFQHTTRRDDPMLSYYMEPHTFPTTLPLATQNATQLQVDWLYRGYKMHGVPWPQRRRRWVPFYYRQDASFVNYTDPTEVSATTGTNVMTALPFGTVAGGNLCPMPAIQCAQILSFLAGALSPGALTTWGGVGFGGFCLFAPLQRRIFASYVVPADATQRIAVPFTNSMTIAALATPVIIKIRRQFHYIFSGVRFQPTPVVHPGYAFDDYTRHGSVTATIQSYTQGPMPGKMRSGACYADWVSAANPDGDCCV